MKLKSYQPLEHDTDSAYYASYVRDMGFSFIVRKLSFIEISAILNFHFIWPHRESVRLLHEKRFGHERVGIDS